MPILYPSPAQEYGQAVRRLPPRQRRVEVRDFYAALFHREGATIANALTTLTLSVWDHPRRYR